MVTLIGIELTKELPESGVVGSTYRIEGNVKLFNAVGTPPFIYAKIQYKEWYKPEALEEVHYERAWPEPGTGDFVIDFKPEDEGDYEVTIVNTPALVPLPAIGVSPILAESDVMKIAIGQKPDAAFRFSDVVIDGNNIHLSNHNADAQLLIQKTTTDYLDITPSYEWVGPSKNITISIKAGYKDFLGGFSPKTEAYTRNITLPESPETPFTGGLSDPIRIPLTKCGGLTDGAVEIVAKISGEPDYITHIWNVYATEEATVAFRFTDMDIDGNVVQLGNHDADSGLLLEKTTADYLDIVPGFEWQGPQKAVTISIKAGYKDFLGGFTPKTGAYTRSVTLPASPNSPYAGEVSSPIRIPLTACGGLDDGAVEVVLKISGEPDYISHIWNVYTTKEPEEPGEEDQPQTLEVDITPTTGGYVTTEPAPTSGPSQWGDDDTGLFPYGTRVKVTAHPHSGYRFDHWSDEIEGGVNYQNPAYVAGTMTEHRAVKAHFVEIAEPAQTLEVDITPSGSGYVTTDPQPESGPSQWYDDNTGTFPYGTRVKVTAHPHSGYRFDHWTDEIEGGTSYQNPAYVTGTMTEHRAVKAHFVLIEQEPTTPPDADIRNIDMQVAAGKYKIGDYVHFDFDFEYQGKAQSGQLTLSIGTGPIGTFFTKQTYLPMSVSFAEAMSWAQRRVSGSFVLTAALEPGQTYSMRGKLETLSDPTQETDTDWGVIEIEEVQVGVSFEVKIWGIPDFGSYEKWACYYFDPAINAFVGDGVFHNSYDRIDFNNVLPGGYLAIFLKRDSSVSPQYTSPTFNPTNGETVTYDVGQGHFY